MQKIKLWNAFVTEREKLVNKKLRNEEEVGQ